MATCNLPLRHEGKSNNDEITNSITTAFAFLGVLVSSWLLSSDSAAEGTVSVVIRGRWARGVRYFFSVSVADLECDRVDRSPVAHQVS